MSGRAPDPAAALIGLDGLDTESEAPPRPRPGEVTLTLDPEAAERMRAEIARAGGREVCFLATVTPQRVVVQPRAVARGNHAAVLAAARDEPEGSVMIHNHPSGALAPSDADLDALAVRVGTPIYAAASGWVTVAGQSQGDGVNTQIVIQHDGANDGYSTEYYHWIRSYVRPGDYVRAGDPIAEVGSVGYSTGPHLHFTVVDTTNGQQLDPAGCHVRICGCRWEPDRAAAQRWVSGQVGPVAATAIRATTVDMGTGRVARYTGIGSLCVSCRRAGFQPC